MKFTVELDDGAVAPLDEYDWALLRPCGCAEVITLAHAGDDEVLATATMAFAVMEPIKRKREAMTRNGYTVKLMPRAEASALFLTKCTHESVFRALVTYARGDGSTWTSTYGPYGAANTARGVATQKARRRYRWGTESAPQDVVVIQRATIAWQDMPQ